MKLRRLVLSECWRLASLPATIGALSELESLEMWGTAIPSLPETLGTLTALRTLAWSGDHGPQAFGTAPLPDALCLLSRLEALAVACDTISALPAEIGVLSALRTLTVSSDHNLRVGFLVA